MLTKTFQAAFSNTSIYSVCLLMNISDYTLYTVMAIYQL